MKCLLYVLKHLDDLLGVNAEELKLLFARCFFGFLAFAHKFMQYQLIGKPKQQSTAI